jgi:hypothetical protein
MLPASGWPGEPRVLIQSAVAMRIAAAVEETSGEVIDAGPLVGWLLDLAGELSRELMGRCWQPATFTALHAGVDAAGRKLPSTAAVVAQRLGWIPRTPAGVYVPSRVARLAQANVVPILKTMAYRDRLIPHVLAALDADRRWDRDRLGSDQLRYVDEAFLRNLVRELSRRGDESGVASITQIQPAPGVPAIARLGAVDAQLAQFDTTDAAGVWLRIKLPATRTPAARADWRWYRLWCPIPPHLKHREIRAWHLPTISKHRGPPLLRFTISEDVSEPDTANAASALGIDWSPASLGVATMVAETAAGLVTDARTHVYNDRGLGVRLARLQAEGQHLSAKIDRLSALAAGAAEPTKAQLTAKITVLQRHRAALGTKRRRINRDIAFDFAKTMTSMATASDAGVIAVEDLRGLDPGGRGRANNNRAAQSARRQAYRALEHTAARAGLEVVMCPPRGTSSLCPGCDHELLRPNGYHSASCGRCGINGADRDQIAGQNIAKRVLVAKTKVKRRKGKPNRITIVAHRPVTKTRQKTTATPKQHRHKRVRRTAALPRSPNRPFLHAKRPCGTETSPPHQRKAPLQNRSPTPATHQTCQRVSEIDRRSGSLRPARCRGPGRGWFRPPDRRSPCASGFP